MNEPTRTLWDIGNGTILRVFLFGIFFWALFFLRDLLLVIITAIVLASAIEPMIVVLGKKRVGRVAAVAIIYLLIAIAFIAVFYFFIPLLVDDLLGFLSKFQEQFHSFNLSTLPNLSGFSSLNDASGGLSILQDSSSFIQGLLDLRNAVSGVSGGVINLTSAVFGGLLSFVPIAVLTFYFAVQETGLDDFIRIVTPVRKQDYVLNLWKRSQAKIGLWMQGQLLLAFIVMVLVYLGLTILGVPYAFFLALMAGIFELIPVFGPVLSAIPAAAVAFSDGGVSLGLMTIGLFLIVQQFENHLIYPLVVRKVIGIHPIMVIIALLAGAKLAGLLGIILSVPLAAALREYIDDIQKKKERDHKMLAPKV